MESSKRNKELIVSNAALLHNYSKDILSPTAKGVTKVDLRLLMYHLKKTLPRLARERIKEINQL